jgi:GT2 family glycosyltransferase/tetratricopeptide (TPR) repeat protein
VVDQIGTFDERFGIHCFEDIDLCRRATGAGLQAVIARDAFIHHYGHRSYSGAGLDQDELAKEGEERFRAKWLLPPDDVAELPLPGDRVENTPDTSPNVPDWSELAAQLIPDGAADVLVVGETGRTLAARVEGVHLQWDQLADANGEFDCIIACGLADLSEISSKLMQLRQHLRRQGALIADFPNARHRDVVSGLLDGAWCSDPTQPSSSRDPIRFTTRREVERMLDRAGFELDTLEIISDHEHAERPDYWSEELVDLGRLRIAGLTSAEAGEFFAGGFVTRSRVRPATSYGLTSIVVVTHNEVEYTRRCLDSIAWRTDEPYEVIVVDNGSTDSTVPYLRNVSGVTLLTNAENRGFPAAVNQGLKVAKGDQVLLLNNDTVVTTGWLRRMLDGLVSDSNIGLVGPCSNNVSGEQQIPVEYESLADLDGFAWDWSKAHRGDVVETDRLVGFSLLIRRQVLNQIGGLDERFGIGCYEDDDFCRRARNAGFRTVIARDAFVHHFGSRTFVGTGVDLGRILEDNRVKYEAKWNQHASVPKLDRWSLTVSDEGGLQLVPKKAKLSLCMIVRDNEGTIRPCLESIRPWVDEMIVVDTGSRDRTPEIARELGARIYEFPWCDDFSAARNESLRHATGEWIFWMDSDDTITADCGRQLRELALGSHSENVFGYVIQVHCPAPGEYDSEDVTVVDHVKLIRNHAPLRFEGRIHEQIIPAIRRLGGDVAWTELYVTHSGADHSPETRARKLERDFRLLHLELQEKPDHPFVLFNFGMTHVDAEQFGEAVRYLRRYLEVADPGESTFRKGYALLVASLCRQDDFDGALTTCQKGLELFAEDKELLFRSGVILHHLGRLEAAEEAYLRVLNERTERHFVSIDLAISGYKARHNLALLYEDANNWSKAEAEWRQITAEEPNYAPAWKGLARTLLNQRLVPQLLELANRLKSNLKLSSTAALIAAQYYEATGAIREAERILDQSRLTARNDSDLLREQARLRFTLGAPGDAVPLLEELTELVPKDAAAQRNLAVAYLHAGRSKDAAVASRRSVSLRPESVDTLRILSQALRDSGYPEESQQVQQQITDLEFACADRQMQGSVR